MGEEGIAEAMRLMKNRGEELSEQIREKSTANLKLLGDYRGNADEKQYSYAIPLQEYHRKQAEDLAEIYQFDLPTLNHLSLTYGARAKDIARMVAAEPEKNKKLHEKFLNIEAEVEYIARYELVGSPIDILLRRTRMAFENATAAREALPKVVEICGGVNGWDGETLEKEIRKAEFVFDKLDF